MTGAPLSDRDAAVLRALADNGELRPDADRHTLLYFHPLNDGDPAAADALRTAAALADRNGWRIAALRDDALIIEDEQDVLPETVAARSAWAEALAEELGLDFDGWECAVVTQSEDGDDV